MEYFELVDLCKRMVKEYYNRYVHMDELKIISVDNVNIIGISETDKSVKEIILQVDVDPWLQYIVQYDESKKRGEDIVTYVEMT